MVAVGTSAATMTYRPDIDGLRALAVLGVLFFHAGIGVEGGYVGVDVFFVISGYLITGLIRKDLNEGRFSLLGFWERRIRRIMPPLVVVVFMTLAAGWWLLLAEDFKELGQSVVAQVLLLANVFFWRESGYFEQSADLQPLLHTWSLAVEEQFYLFFPPLLVALNKTARLLRWSVLLITLMASLALAVYWSHTRPEAGFYLLPTRAWELLLGALLSMTQASYVVPRRWLAELLGDAGLCMILYAMFVYDKSTPFPGIAALLPCLGAVLVIGCGTRSISGKVLAWPGIAGVGLISYSLYLWHWPLLVFSKYWASVPLTGLQRFLLLVSSGILAFLSWKYVEQPFRRRAVCSTRRSIYCFATLCSVSLFLLAFGIHYMNGVPARIPTEVQAYANGRFDCAFRKEVSLAQAQHGEFIRLGGDAGGPLAVLVWGDSHAMALLPVIDDLCREKGGQGVAAVHYQMPPLVNYQSRGHYSLKEKTPLFSAAVLDFVRSKQVPHVVLTAAWNYHFDEAGRKHIRQALLETVTALKEAGAKVWVMEDVPVHTFDVPRRLAAAVLFGGEKVEAIGLPLDVHRADCIVQHEVLQELAPQNYTLLDPAGLFSNAQGLCRVATGGHALYTDASHISVQGALLLRPLLSPVFN